MPYREAPKHDFRPRADTLAGKRDVKFFVPFGLYETVAEWDFSRNQANPEVVTGLNFNMTEEYFTRVQYYDVPWNNLAVPGAKAGDYATGVLEDWTDSALNFDGRIYGVYTHEAMTRDYPLSCGLYRDEESKLHSLDLNMPERKLQRMLKRNPNLKQRIDEAQKVFPGRQRQTVDMQANNFLLELVFRADKAGGSLVSKLSETGGYELLLDNKSMAVMALVAGGKRSTLTGKTRVSDGKWHHLIAEVDRRSETIRIYLDGEMDASGPILLRQEATLGNEADFFVGKGSGGMFQGSLDFLRVSRGTLADARTTIQELYAWQFNGPFLRDFAGRSRDASEFLPGAIGQ
jgi:hypothetical protein